MDEYKVEVNLNVDKLSVHQFNDVCYALSRLMIAVGSEDVAIVTSGFVVLGDLSHLSPYSAEVYEILRESGKIKESGNVVSIMSRLQNPRKKD